jgi:hypothetical protein
VQQFLCSYDSSVRLLLGPFFFSPLRAFELPLAERTEKKRSGNKEEDKNRSEDKIACMMKQTR